MRERYWAAVVAGEQYADERLYAHDVISVWSAAGADRPRAQEQVLLLAAGDPPLMFGLGRVSGSFRFGESPADRVTVQYTHRLLDDAVPLPALTLPPGVHPISAAEFARLGDRVGADRRIDADKSEWFVSVALPIEAPSPAEAVREFWSYVQKLGPHELPAFVWPRADELSMQAFVLGAVTTLDPEDD